MKSRVSHTDVNDAIFQRIAKLKQQKDQLEVLHVSLSLKMGWFEEQADLLGRLKQVVEFTYTGGTNQTIRSTRTTSTKQSRPGRTSKRSCADWPESSARTSSTTTGADTSLGSWVD